MSSTPRETHSLPDRLCHAVTLVPSLDDNHSFSTSRQKPHAMVLTGTGLNGRTDDDIAKCMDAMQHHDQFTQDLVGTSPSDLDCALPDGITSCEPGAASRFSIKPKHCIEKEYVHVIIVDHSMLPEELERRKMVAEELMKCSAAKEDDHPKGFNPRSVSATPKEPRTPSARLRLTGESIRKLVKMMSPASYRRHRTKDLHGSESSLSGDTLTGSTRSLSGICELEFSSQGISEAHASA